VRKIAVARNRQGIECGKREVVCPKELRMPNARGLIGIYSYKRLNEGEKSRVGVSVGAPDHLHDFNLVLFANLLEQ
jgi:hypothetical protein